MEEIRNYPYPAYDKRELWSMSSNDFNAWRRKYDFPRIVAFLQQELKDFAQWQKEQKITSEQLISEGISGFILEQEDYHLSVLNKQTQPLKMPHKKFIPYFTWARKKKIKPHSQVVDYTLRPSGFSWNPTTQTSEVKMLTKLRLLDLGGLVHRGVSLERGSRTTEGSKNFEFTCLDHSTFLKCHDAPTALNFSSARNISIIDCSFHHLSAFSTDFTGLSIAQCSLQSWTLSKCRLTGYISNSKIKESEIKYWKLHETNFFDFFSSLKIFDSKFTFKKDEYLQYKNVKNAYREQGEKPEAGKYYYLERRAHLQARKNYFLYHRWKLPFGTTRDGYSKFFSGVQYKFKSKKFSFFNATLDLFKFLAFRLRIFFSRKYFLNVLHHYFNLLLDYLDQKVRGYGEKPERIIITAFILLIVFTLADSLYFLDEKNYVAVFYQNLLVFIGQGEFEKLSTPRLSFRILQTVLGIFLISLFIADFSSKHRH